MTLRKNQKGLSPSLVTDITEFLWWSSLFSFSFSLFSVSLSSSLLLSFLFVFSGSPWKLHRANWTGLQSDLVDLSLVLEMVQPKF